MAGLFRRPRTQEPPPPPPPTPMADEEAIKRAKERALRTQRARGGRQSTLLARAAETEEKRRMTLGGE